MGVSWEALSAIAAAITAVVITVTAIVAILQISHLRAANQLAAALSLYRELDDLGDVRTFVSNELDRRMQDPMYRRDLETGVLDRKIHLEVRLGNYWEKFGLLLRTGLLDRELFLDWGSVSCLRDWRSLRDVTCAIRIKAPEVWRDFECLAHLAAIHSGEIKRKPLAQRKWPEGFEDLDINAEHHG